MSASPSCAPCPVSSRPATRSRSSGVAAPYLEQRGESVPADPAERAARLLTLFLASLWDGSAEFSLDREALEEALAVLGAEVGDVDEAEIWSCRSPACRCR